MESITSFSEAGSTDTCSKHSREYQRSKGGEEAGSILGLIAGKVPLTREGEKEHLPAGQHYCTKDFPNSAERTGVGRGKGFKEAAREVATGFHGSSRQRGKTCRKGKMTGRERATTVHTGTCMYIWTYFPKIFSSMLYMNVRVDPVSFVYTLLTAHPFSL